VKEAADSYRDAFRRSQDPLTGLLRRMSDGASRVRDWVTAPSQAAPSQGGQATPSQGGQATPSQGGQAAPSQATPSQAAPGQASPGATDTAEEPGEPNG